MENINEEIYNEFVLKYQFALNILETNIKNLLSEYDFNHKDSVYDHIKVRIKSKDSTLRKLEMKGLPISVDNIAKHLNDIVGIRIVCPFLSDVYTVINMLQNCKFFKIEEEKDYITNPKDTGYISYHFIVSVPVQLQEGIKYFKAEIQVRTMAMDFWASLDHKLQYKFDEDMPDDIKYEMYKCSVDIKNLDEKMLALKNFINDYTNKK